MENRKWKAAVVTLSDKGYAGEREDKSGPLVCEILRDAGYDVQKTKLLRMNRKKLKNIYVNYVMTIKWILFSRREERDFLQETVLLKRRWQWRQEMRRGSRRR